MSEKKLINDRKKDKSGAVNYVVEVKYNNDTSGTVKDKVHHLIVQTVSRKLNSNDD